MKRFWKDAAVVEKDGGYAIALDGRRVKTPARAPLAVPTAALAEAIAGEWRGAGVTIDPRAMPLTGFANAAIDRVAAGPDAFVATLAKYGETDLLCYRADSPAVLVRRQGMVWDPLLAWARRRYDIDFRTTDSPIYAAQPAATVERLAHAVAALDHFRLAGLAPLVTIGGSLVAALAVIEDWISADLAWDAVSLDDQWQLEQWGADADAQSALDARRRDFLAAGNFLKLLD